MQSHFIQLGLFNRYTSICFFLAKQSGEGKLIVLVKQKEKFLFFFRSKSSKTSRNVMKKNNHFHLSSKHRIQSRYTFIKRSLRIFVNEIKVNLPFIRSFVPFHRILTEKPSLKTSLGFKESQNQESKICETFRLVFVKNC